MTHKQRYIGHCVICLKLYGEAVAVQKGRRDHERYCVKRGHKVTGRSNDLHLIEESDRKNRIGGNKEVKGYTWMTKN